jgi:hypothetical protein
MVCERQARCCTAALLEYLLSRQTTVNALPSTTQATIYDFTF